MKLLAFPILLLILAAGLLGPGREATAYAGWWLTNSEPPSLVLSAPAGAVRGTLEVNVEAVPAGRVDLQAAEVDGREVTPGQTLRLETSNLPDGEHVLTMHAQDRSLRRNSATSSVRFSSDNTPPSFDVQPSPTSVPQGHTTVVHIRPSEQAEVRASLNGGPVRLFPVGDQYWAVIGADSSEPPGAWDLVVEGRDRVGNAGRSSVRLGVAPFNFPRDAVQVPATLLPLLAADLRTAEDERLKTVYLQESGPPMWKGPFLPPVLGPVSTEFGEIRSYNGGPFGGNHNGTDFQAGAGAPVQASARGRVVFTEEVRLRGRVLILDHGGGVFTTYAHLSEWLVERGHEVQPGQPIARVGSTGLSTGPHLHWELWVSGKAVNPVEWTEREFP